MTQCLFGKVLTVLVGYFLADKKLHTIGAKQATLRSWVSCESPCQADRVPDETVSSRYVKRASRTEKDVIPHILPDTTLNRHSGDVEFVQLVLRSNARKHQQLGRHECPSAHNDFLRSLDTIPNAIGLRIHASCSLLVVKSNLGCMRVCEYFKVRRALIPCVVDVLG